MRSLLRNGRSVLRVRQTALEGCAAECCGDCDCRCSNGAARPAYCCDADDPRYNNPECRCENACSNSDGVYKILPLCCSLPGGCGDPAVCECTECATNCCPSVSGYYSCPGQAFVSDIFLDFSIADVSTCWLSAPCQQMYSHGPYVAAAVMRGTGTFTNCAGGLSPWGFPGNPQPTGAGVSHALRYCPVSGPSACSSTPGACVGPLPLPGLFWSRSASSGGLIWGPILNSALPGGAPIVSVQWLTTGYSGLGAVGSQTVSAGMLTGVGVLPGPGIWSWRFGGSVVFAGNPNTTINCGGAVVPSVTGRSGAALFNTGPVWRCADAPPVPILEHPTCVDPFRASRGLFLPRRNRAISIPTAAQVSAIADGEPITAGSCSSCGAGGLTW